MKIGTKISLSFLLTAAVLTGIAVPLVYYMEKNNLEKAIYSHLVTTARSRMKHIETLLWMRKDDVVQLSNGLIFENFLNTRKKSPDYQKMLDMAVKRLKRVKASDKFIYEVFLLNNNGVIVASTDENRIGLDRSTDAYFLGARDGPYIKDAYYSAAGLKSLAFSAPVTDKKTGDFIGVIVNRVSLEQLNEITEDNTGLGSTGEIYLLNKYGYMITPSRFLDDTFLKKKVDTRRIKHCRIYHKRGVGIIHEDRPALYMDYRGVKVVGVCDHISEMKWILVAEIDDREVLLPLIRLRSLLLSILLIVPVVAFGIGNFVSGLIAGPIEKLHRGTERVGEGDLDYKVGTSADDEIGQLSRAFDKMASDLKKTTTSIDALNKEINERKKIEQALQKSTAQLQAILDGSPEVILQIDTDLKVLWANKAAHALNPDIVGKPCYQSYVSREEEPGECSCKKALDSGKIITEIVYQHALKDVRVEKYWESIGVPLVDADGRTTGVIVIARDITDRKQAEEALRVSEQKFKDLTETTPDWIWEVDRDGKYIYVGPKVKELLGYEAGEVMGKTPFDFMPEDEAERVKIIFNNKINNTEGLYKLENINRHKDGHLVVLETNGIPVFDKKGRLKGYRGIDRDITDRKEAEEKLKEAMEIKSSFTSMVSHELRTPLAAIKEGIGIVYDGMAGEVSEQQKDFLGIAKRNVDRLARLINDVLDFQKLESGKVDFNFSENDVNDVIKEVYSTMSSMAEEKGLKFIIKSGDNLPRVKCDKDKIIQVLGNIVNNAVKFTDKGEITITSVLADNKIRVSVQDTGPGIKEEDMPRLFHKFEQITPVKDRKPGGTGLGLAISKEIIERHGGKIWAESEFGKGTTFLFTLPVK